MLDDCFIFNIGTNTEFLRGLQQNNPLYSQLLLLFLIVHTCVLLSVITTDIIKGSYICLQNVLFL